MFSSVSAPFCWPTTATRRPSSRASPTTIAASSPKRRSPWSSTKSSVIASTNSSVRGRARLRASWTRAQTSSRGSPSDGRSVGASGGVVAVGALADPFGQRRSGTRTAGSRASRCRGRPGCRRSATARTGSRRSSATSSSRSSGRLTTRSMKPCSNRNSERWKPGGSSWAIVPAETRDPANPMSAFGSAMLTSPTAANEANTPPVVGSDRTDRNGTPPTRSRSSAASVLASCISARVPSCIRAPPEALTTTSGIRASSACSAARVTFSPTTAPIDPPMNPKSMTQIATGIPDIAAVPQTAASRIPVAAWAAASRSGYDFWSTNPRRSTDWRPASRSAQVPGSTSWLEPRRGRQAEMVAAGRADPHGLVELLVEDHRFAGRALGPQVGRVDVAPGAERRQLDRHQASLDRATARAARTIGPVAGRFRRQAT